MYETFHGIEPELRKALLQELQEGKIFFLNWRKRSIIGSGIRFVEWVKYNLSMKKNWDVDKSHSSTLIGIFTPLQTIVDRLIHLEALGRGITPNSLSWSLDQSDVDYVDVYEINLGDDPNTEKVLEAIQQAYGLAWDSVNKPYGFTTIASILFSTVLISIFGYERVIGFSQKTGLYDWLIDKLRKNNICSQFNTLLANLYRKLALGESFISEKDAPFVDPEAFESLTNKLIHRYRIYGNV